MLIQNFNRFRPLLGSYEDEDEDGSSDQSLEGGVATAKRVKTKRPSLYKVLLHNDDYTTMEFVVFILRKIFFKTIEQAEAVMLEVHHNGLGVCGVYTHEIAETKAYEVMDLAKKEGHPLKCTIDPE